MNNEISEECKNKMKELESKLVWSIKTLKESSTPDLIIPEIMVFLKLSCRFAAQHMDDSCKKLMSGYENDILHLNIRATSEKIVELEKLKMKLNRNAK